MSAAQRSTVSVVIPVHNGERFIRRALDSVLAQTLPAAEIVVVDDGSTDGTAEILAAEYAGRIRLITQTGHGVSHARNRGMEATSGDWIAMLDADDWWDPGKLQAQLGAVAEAPDTVGNYTGLKVHHEDTGAITEQAPVPVDDLSRLLRLSNPSIPPSSMMLRRSALQAVGTPFREDLRASEDWELWLRLSRVGRFTVCPEFLTNYRLSSTGLSGDADLMFGSFLRMLDDTLLAEFKGVERQLWRRRIVSYQAFKSMLTARAAGNRARERFYMWRSMVTWPSPFWAPERFRYFAVTLLRSR